ncbi:hypothetical protein [Duganella sp. S19_KUP01_CR8]|uniref:hypothetical protein n=1 Tax=Duganella sp. S19_KUP01_CR8 TaxID=3025502 RepID=UPI002FCD7142
MAMTAAAERVLREYVRRAQTEGELEKLTITNAVRLTPQQQETLKFLLAALWDKQDYQCPAVLPLKPNHGYQSRVLKDGYTGQQFIDWLVIGCSDAATASAATDGTRVHLGSGPMQDATSRTYNLIVPIRSDIHGSVYIDDVIPKGLPAIRRKGGSSPRG